MKNVLFFLLLVFSFSSCQLTPEEDLSRRSANDWSDLPNQDGLHLTYYVNSERGSDTNNGLSPDAPFRTIARVNQLQLDHGNYVLFAAGQTFEGTLTLNGKTGNPLATDPVLVATYGADTTRAIIRPAAGSAAAISIADFPGIDVRNFVLDGSLGSALGVNITATNPSTAVKYTHLTALEAKNFNDYGIFVYADRGQGLEDIVINRCVTHDNGQAGISSYADPYPSHLLKNFTVRNSWAYHNQGVPGNTATNTGSGIVLEGIDGGLIEHCRASDNGAKNAHRGGGPMGIWCYDSHALVIQFCEADHNKRSLDADGGGFDIDGGSADCAIQYCFSHDNEGEGYGLFEFGSPSPYHNNLIRFCISDRDREGISIWANSGSQLRDSYAYNNTIRGPLGYLLQGGSYSGVYCWNTLYVGPTFQSTTDTQVQFYTNVTRSTYNFVDGYHLPSGDPLASAGCDVDHYYNDRDYYGTPTNGVFPIGASK
jgi:hypothetical protein